MSWTAANTTSGEDAAEAIAAAVSTAALIGQHGDGDAVRLCMAVDDRVQGDAGIASPPEILLPAIEPVPVESIAKRAWKGKRKRTRVPFQAYRLKK